MKKTLFLFLSLALFGFISCGKEGTGGKAVIKGQVKHHDKLIPGAVVYIKYGAKDFPGSNVTYYDASVTADAQANYAFPDLKKGDYYLFGIGYDSAIALPVSGGIHAEIKKKTETVEINVPVTE
jgi:hypothetical protein